ncbi:MAG TPA: aldo/keto reductase [Streptosporangiaceae bacterium]
MKTRTIGSVTVSAIGLGGMPMSIEGRPDEDRSIRTIHAALDAGVTLIDTADAYHLHAGETGHNERLIAKALATYSGDTSGVLVATKGGHIRPGDGSWTVDGSRAHLRDAVEASLKALGVEAIGLYQFHRPDPKVPYEESVGVLTELLDAGKIRLAGISNATVEQIDIARRVLGEGRLASVQNQFSPAFRTSENELRHTAAHGVAFLPWSPLGGIGRAGDLGSRHAAFAEIAEAHGVSPQRVTLAWMLALAPTVIPIPGASRPESITDSAQAPDLVLTPEEVDRLTRA